MREYKRAYEESAEKTLVRTEISNQVYETLEYAQAVNGFVVIEGVPRIGKTKSVQTWCESHLGIARYVQVPPTPDDKGFYWHIARALGVSCCLQSKAQELRERIEDTLLTCPLMLVFDEAHWLWPPTTRREAWPHRINWIISAIVNQGVPVACVATPQFTSSQETLVAKTGWKSEQLVGRYDDFRQLPKSLSGSDLTAIAKAMLPQGDDQCIAALVDYAQQSSKYVAAIQATVKRAQYVATRDGRHAITRADIKRVLKESMLTSEAALNAALQAAKGKKSRRSPVLAPEPPIRRADPPVAVALPESRLRVCSEIAPVLEEA